MPDRIRAKVYVSEVANRATMNGKHAEYVRFGFVAANDPTTENHRFHKATPSGTFEMHIDNEGAWGFFEPGREYYVDLTPAS